MKTEKSLIYFHDWRKRAFCFFCYKQDKTSNLYWSWLDNDPYQGGVFFHDICRLTFIGKLLNHDTLIEAIISDIILNLNKNILWRKIQ